MSTDFIGLLDISRHDVTPEWLLAHVMKSPNVFAYFEERFRQSFRIQAWAVESVGPSRSVPSLVGVGGFAIDIHSRTVELWHGIRFGLFTSDSLHRESLRRVCLFFANLIGSQRAIYTHECMPYRQDECLAGIESGLRAQIGPPADTFEELDAAEYFGPRAWYIDTFADICLSRTTEA
jgi:hypothetical protein